MGGILLIRRYSWALGWILLVSLLVGGCGARSEPVRFVHPTYGFSVEVPAGWRVNQVKWAPPPPEGTYISSSNNKLVVSIIAWTEKNVMEQNSLLQDGWGVQKNTVDGVEALLFSRPDFLPGTWKRAYLQRDEVWYEISLSVQDPTQALAGEQAFAAVISSLRWAPPSKGEL